jgi:integrase/recombinase XerD
MKPTIKYVLDTRKAKNSGKFPIKLRVTYQRERSYYSLWFDLTKEDYHRMMNPASIPEKAKAKYKKELQAIKTACDKELVKAIGICEQMSDFNIILFEKRYLGVKKETVSLVDYYHEEIANKKARGNISTASNYESSLKSLQSFYKNINFKVVTPSFLNDYEHWLLKNGRSISTVGIYLRPLRAIILRAIEEETIPRELYPFSKRKYQIPATRNVKKALSLEELEGIFKYDAIPNTWLEKARDFFLFSYLASGMNIKDILQLKNSNIDEDFIRFTRAKTKSTIRSGAIPISVHIEPELQVIINRHRNQSTDKNDYLFNVLTHDLTPERERAVIQQFTKMINKYIKIIADKVGINKPITTYYARHSYATVMYRKGVSTEFIAENMGHRNVKTTEAYKDGLDDETKKKMQSILTQFKKTPDELQEIEHALYVA